MAPNRDGMMSGRLRATWAIAALAACADPSLEPGAAVVEGHRFAVVTTSEFGAAGSVAVVDLDSLRVYPDLTTTHHDAWVRVGEDAVYVLNRQGADNVQLLDPRLGFGTRWERSVGERGNPWDLVELGDGRAAVLLYGEGSVALVDLAQWDLDAAIRLRPPAGRERDGSAEPGAVLVRDGVIYVLVQGLGAYPRCEANDRGSIHAYSASDGRPLRSFGADGVLELAACNPLSWVEADDGTLWVAQSGNHRSLVGEAAVDDGAIERIDLAGGRSLGVVTTEAGLGDADLLRLVRGDGGRYWALLAHADFSMSVHGLELSAQRARLGEAVWSGEGIFAVAEYDGRLWIADRRRPGAALVVLDAAAPLDSDPVRLDTGYAPFDIAFIETDDDP